MSQLDQTVKFACALDVVDPCLTGKEQGISLTFFCFPMDQGATIAGVPGNAGNFAYLCGGINREFWFR